MKWLAYSLMFAGGVVGVMLTLADTLTGYRKDFSYYGWLAWCVLATGFLIQLGCEARAWRNRTGTVRRQSKK